MEEGEDECEGERRREYGCKDGERRRMSVSVGGGGCVTGRRGG